MQDDPLAHILCVKNESLSPWATVILPGRLAPTAGTENWVDHQKHVASKKSKSTDRDYFTRIYNVLGDIETVTYHAFGFAKYGYDIFGELRSTAGAIWRQCSLYWVHVK